MPQMSKYIEIITVTIGIKVEIEKIDYAQVIKYLEEETEEKYFAKVTQYTKRRNRKKSRRR